MTQDKNSFWNKRDSLYNIWWRHVFASYIIQYFY